MRYGEVLSACGAIVVVAGLIGLLSQHPRYARLPVRVVAIGLSLLAPAFPIVAVVPAIVAVLWDENAQTLALLLGLLTAIAYSAVNVVCLFVQAYREQPA